MPDESPPSAVLYAMLGRIESMLGTAIAKMEASLESAIEKLEAADTKMAAQIRALELDAANAKGAVRASLLAGSLIGAALSAGIAILMHFVK